MKNLHVCFLNYSSTVFPFPYFPVILDPRYLLSRNVEIQEEKLSEQFSSRRSYTFNSDNSDIIFTFSDIRGLIFLAKLKSWDICPGI